MPADDFVFPPAPQASLAVQGTDARFPMRRIFCVGRNYEAHAREMGKDPTRLASSPIRPRQKICTTRSSW